MSGDGRTVQSVARNPMQATQARTAKALSSVPEHVFHGSIAWLNMSMSGVSHEFFAGLAEADRARSEKLANSEILDIASQFVTRPYTEEELKEVLKDAARKAWELRTGRKPDPDKARLSGPNGLRSAQGFSGEADGPSAGPFCPFGRRPRRFSGWHERAADT